MTDTPETPDEATAANTETGTETIAPNTSNQGTDSPGENTVPAGDESVAEPEDSELAAAATTPAAPPELIGIGAALVDWLMDVDDDFLAANVDGAKGGMELVDGVEAQENLIQAGEKPASRAAGGAAANTTVGAANLGINAGFIGAVGGDATGNFFRSELERQNCQSLLREKAELPTGQVLSMVTPDAERTMRTFLWCQHADEFRRHHRRGFRRCENRHGRRLQPL